MRGRVGENKGKVINGGGKGNGESEIKAAKDQNPKGMMKRIEKVEGGNPAGNKNKQVSENQIGPLVLVVGVDQQGQEGSNGEAKKIGELVEHPR